MTEKIKKYFGSMGLNFPENDNELDAFNKTHKGYEYSLKEELIDPYKILDNLKKENPLKIKVNNTDYHKRTVLAAEIVYQLKDDTSLGHLKLQKLIYLCQNTSNMSLHANFLRQAMGPYDPKLMRSIDSQFKSRRWFEFKIDKFPKYQVLEKAGEHKEWYERYFNNHIDNINFIIETFKRFKTSQIELVATLYACWQNAIETKSIITNDLLIKEVYNWHESKEKFSKASIENAIKWMEEKGIYPDNSTKL